MPVQFLSMACIVSESDVATRFFWKEEREMRDFFVRDGKEPVFVGEEDILERKFDFCLDYELCLSFHHGFGLSKEGFFDIFRRGALAQAVFYTGDH